MNKTIKKILFFILFILIPFIIYSPSMTLAETSLPSSVQAQLHVPLAQVGSGVYRKFGFSIYQATLWAPFGVWDKTKPFALELQYMRNLSKETIVDAALDSIRDQDIADEKTIAKWEKILNQALPAVQNNDIVGLVLPGQKSILYHNGKMISSLDDQALSAAFFNIWLGDGADEDLRKALLSNQ